MPVAEETIAEAFESTSDETRTGKTTASLDKHFLGFFERDRLLQRVTFGEQGLVALIAGEVGRGDLLIEQFLGLIGFVGRVLQAEPSRLDLGAVLRFGLSLPAFGQP